MIKFRLQQSMFDMQKVQVSWNIDFDKNTYGPASMDVSEVQNFKERIVRKLLHETVSGMVKSRKNAFLYASAMREEHWKAIQYLKYNLDELKATPTIGRFFAYLKENILPHLAHIEPGKNSRFVSFTQKLDSITAFADRFIAYQSKVRATNANKELKAV